MPAQPSDRSYFQVSHNQLTCEVKLTTSPRVSSRMLAAAAQSVAAGINVALCLTGLTGTFVAEVDSFHRVAFVRPALPLLRSERHDVRIVTDSLVASLHGFTVTSCPRRAQAIARDGVGHVNDCLRTELLLED